MPGDQDCAGGSSEMAEDWSTYDLMRAQRRFERRGLFRRRRARGRRWMLWAAVGLTAWGSVAVALML